MMTVAGSIRTAYSRQHGQHRRQLTGNWQLFVVLPKHSCSTRALCGVVSCGGVRTLLVGVGCEGIKMWGWPGLSAHCILFNASKRKAVALLLVSA
jgi:hypothetical protein